MEYNIIIEVLESVEPPFYGADLLYELAILDARTPAEVMPDTQTVGGKYLIHLAINSSSKDIRTFFNSLIISYELPWVIRGIRARTDPQDIVDEKTGDVIPFVPNVPMPVHKDALLYLNPRYDKNDVELTKEANWFHQYSGQEAWI